jgi:hypothetical protein
MSDYLPKIIKRLQDGSYTPHTQIVFFKDGTTRTIMDVRYIWQNQMTHLITGNGIEFIINPLNVNYIQRYLDYKNSDL